MLQQIRSMAEISGIIKVNGFHEQILDCTLAINLFSYPTLPVAKYGQNVTNRREFADDRRTYVQKRSRRTTMPNKLQCEQPKDKLGSDERETLDNLIREQVIHALGAPFNLRSVQVRKVWDDHYRVNVLVNVGAGTVRVANSFFLVTDSDGCLTAATPKITRLY
jgi:hypothetical protein